MANGTIAFDTLTTSDTVNTGTEKSIDTSYIYNGVAKAWIHVPDGAGSINDSFNITSLDDDGTGDHGINYTNSMGSANYTLTGGIGDDGHASIVMNVDITETTQAAGSVDFEFVYTNASYNRQNFDGIGYLTIHGDLA